MFWVHEHLKRCRFGVLADLKNVKVVFCLAILGNVEEV